MIKNKKKFLIELACYYVKCYYVIMTVSQLFNMINIWKLNWKPKSKYVEMNNSIDALPLEKALNMQSVVSLIESMFGFK